MPSAHIWTQKCLQIWRHFALIKAINLASHSKVPKKRSYTYGPLILEAILFNGAKDNTKRHQMLSIERWGPETRTYSAMRWYVQQCALFFQNIAEDRPSQPSLEFSGNFLQLIFCFVPRSYSGFYMRVYNYSRLCVANTKGSDDISLL